MECFSTLHISLLATLVLHPSSLTGRTVFSHQVLELLSAVLADHSFQTILAPSTFLSLVAYIFRWTIIFVSWTDLFPFLLKPTAINSLWEFWHELFEVYSKYNKYGKQIGNLNQELNKQTKKKVYAFWPSNSHLRNSP